MFNSKKLSLLIDENSDLKRQLHEAHEELVYYGNMIDSLSVDNEQLKIANNNLMQAMRRIAGDGLL